MPSLPYYVRESYGSGTNLQLYSLRKAWQCWHELNPKAADGRSRERYVLTVALRGLSLSQLLGQNTLVSRERIPSPSQLLATFLEQIDLEEPQRSGLIARFAVFVDFYDACRHFGPPKHEKLDQLDHATTGSFVELAIEIWDLVLTHFRTGREGSLDVRSIRELLDEPKEDEPEYYEADA